MAMLTLNKKHITICLYLSQCLFPLKEFNDFLSMPIRLSTKQLWALKTGKAKTVNSSKHSQFLINSCLEFRSTLPESDIR